VKLLNYLVREVWVLKQRGIRRLKAGELEFMRRTQDKIY